MKYNYVKLFVVALLSTLVWSCEVDPVQQLPERKYQLVWSDEFNDSAGSPVDQSKWVYDLGNGTAGWGNGELQSYTSKPQNISQDGAGNLVITALRDAGGNYTSARIKTKGIMEQQYGRIEARIKTPTGKGIWPAFWMLGNNIDAVSWPQCGEIDVMEQKGQQSSITYGSVHGPGYSGGSAITSQYALKNNRFDNDFYVYAVEWGENYIDFFVNDYLYKRLTPSGVPGEWVYNKPFYLLLNLAVGGSFVGPPNDFTPFPGSMFIDYVRVYKEN